MLIKVLFLLSGFLFLFLAIVGMILPLLPSTPFLLISSFCFVKSSARVNNWFKGSIIYKKYIHEMKTKKGMTLKSKLVILIPVYLILLFLFFAKPIPLMRILILILLTLKTIAFMKIKTIPSEKIKDNSPEKIRGCRTK